MPIKRTLSALVVAVLLAACAGKGREPSALPAFKPKIAARIAWKVSVGPAHNHIFSPAALHGQICATGHNGRVSCFDARSGASTWTRKTGVTLSGGVGTGDNMVLVGSPKGEVIAYGAQGELLWRAEVSSEVLSAPTGLQSTVVVRAGDNKVLGLDAKDGLRKWVYDSTPQVLTLRSNPGMSAVDSTSVVGGFPGGRMVRLDARDGSLLWDIAVATPRGDNELERVADVAGTPLVEDGKVCAVAFQGRIGCYEAANGSQIWARNASSAGSITADSRTIYYTESDGALVALDKGNGASVWRQDKLLYRRVSSPAVIGDWLVVGDFEGFVHVLAREDGSFVARLATDGSEIVAAPLVRDGRAIMQTRAGGVYAIELDG